VGFDSLGDRPEKNRVLALIPSRLDAKPDATQHDARLQAIVEAWPRLPAWFKRQLPTMVRAAVKRRRQPARESPACVATRISKN
jgi:hypothetical protein